MSSDQVFRQRRDRSDARRLKSRIAPGSGRRVAGSPASARTATVSAPRSTAYSNSGAGAFQDFACARPTGIISGSLCARVLWSGSDAEVVGLVGTLTDVTGSSRTAEERLLHDAVHDNLTGFPRPREFLPRPARRGARHGQGRSNQNRHHAASNRDGDRPRPLQAGQRIHRDGASATQYLLDAGAPASPG